MRLSFSFGNTMYVYCRKCFARGSPENWLVNFEETMKKTVKDLLKDGVATYNKESRHQWVLSNPGQVVLTVVNI